MYFFFFFQAEDGIRDVAVTGVQTCALPICCCSPEPPEPLRLSPPSLPPSPGKGLASTSTTPAPWVAPASPPPGPAPTAPPSSSVRRGSLGLRGPTSARALH